MQDSLVVCRLRKNSEFRPSDSSPRASSIQGHLPTLPNSNYAVCEAGIDQSGLSEGDRAVGSSNDSYSTEQIDSTSESEQKRANDVTQAETSSHQKVGFILAKPFVEPYMVVVIGTSLTQRHLIHLVLTL
jgi:hypothetical protein